MSENELMPWTEIPLEEGYFYLKRSNGSVCECQVHKTPSGGLCYTFLKTDLTYRVIDGLGK